MINIRNKGATGEREFARFLCKHGIEARRGYKDSEGNREPDIVSDMTGIHFEVKRTEKLRMWKAVEQAKRDAASNEIPVVAHRPNNKEWIIIISAEDFMRIYHEQT